MDALLKDLDVGVLVNNVGMSYPFCQFFHELSDESVEQLMSLNIDSTTWMTRIVLPGMLERKRGSIVNIGSGIICCILLLIILFIYVYIQYTILFVDHINILL